MDKFYDPDFGEFDGSFEDFVPREIPYFPGPRMHEDYVQQSTFGYIWSWICTLFTFFWNAFCVVLLIVVLYSVWHFTDIAESIHSYVVEKWQEVQLHVEIVKKTVMKQKQQLNDLKRDILALNRLKQHCTESTRRDNIIRIDAAFKARMDHLEKAYGESRKRIQVLETYVAESESEAKQVLRVNSEWKMQLDQQLTDMKKRLQRLESIQKQTSKKNGMVSSKVNQKQESSTQRLIESNHQLQEDLNSLQASVKLQAEHYEKEILELQKKLEQKILEEATRLNCSLGCFSAQNENQAEKSESLIANLTKQFEIMSQEFSIMREKLQHFESSKEENNNQNKLLNKVEMMNGTHQGRSRCDTR